MTRWKSYALTYIKVFITLVFDIFFILIALVVYKGLGYIESNYLMLHGFRHTIYSVVSVLLELSLVLSFLISLSYDAINIFQALRHNFVVEVEVRDEEGQRAVVGLDPSDESSIENFTRALEQENDRRASPELVAALRKRIKAQTDLELEGRSHA